MALTITESRYQEIRRRIIDANLQKSVTEAISKPGETTFSGVEQFFEHLDDLVAWPKGRPERSRKRDY